MKTGKHGVEVIIHDATAQALADLFLPPPGTHISAEELRAACARLAEATRAAKRLARSSEKKS
jgi:hypothetical protein